MEITIDNMTDRTDEQIKKDVVDHLYWDHRVDASDIEIEVDNHEVILRGSVPSYTASEAALFDAWKAEGVTRVDNQLLVEYPPTVEIPTDDDIEKRVEFVLEWNQSTADADIEVRVDHGDVILEGDVDAYWRKFRAQQLVSEVRGVISVNNKLTVVPTEKVTDEVIAKDVIKAIDRSFSVDVNNIDVKVENGIVTLSGVVPDRSTQLVARACAENTFGVLEVEDKLVVSD